MEEEAFQEEASRKRICKSFFKHTGDSLSCLQARFSSSTFMVSIRGGNGVKDESGDTDDASSNEKDPRVA